jgi:hypothetical protein
MLFIGLRSNIQFIIERGGKTKVKIYEGVMAYTTDIGQKT